MAKKESTFLNMVFTLFTVTFVAAMTLGMIYNLTKEPTAEAKLKKKLNAIRMVVPSFTNNPSAEQKNVVTADNLVLEFYPAKQNNEWVGTAIKTYSKDGFSGLIWLMVGFKSDGTIHNISVLEHKETPGLGDKMDKPAFKNQFIGKHPKKNILKVKKDDGEIDAITAATISSRAFCDAVQRAYETYEKEKEKN